MPSNSKCHQTPDVIKLQIPLNSRCRQISDVIKLQVTSNSKWHQTPDAIKHQMSLNSKGHQTPDAIRLQIPSNSRYRQNPDAVKLQMPKKKTSLHAINTCQTWNAIRLGMPSQDAKLKMPGKLHMPSKSRCYQTRYAINTQMPSNGRHTSYAIKLNFINLQTSSNS